jgi:DNA modification methylase
MSALASGTGIYWDVNLLDEWGLDLPPMFDDPEPEATEDDYEEPEQMQVDVVLGDLVEIGEHRLLCGDSADSDQVAKLMNGEKADMVFTDPPYNINFQGSMSNKMVNGKKAPADSANQRHDEIKNDAMSDKEFYNFISDVLKEIKINCSGAYYICFGSQTLNQLLQPLLDLGIEYKSIIVWMKNQAIFSGKDFKSRYEPIVYGRFNDFFNGARFNEEDIWEFARTQKNDLHPTMKPIPLIENALNYSSKKGMKILDLFLGSGSTMVASHQLNRKCYGMELDPKYCQVIIDRMHKLDPSLKIKINGQEYTPNDNGAEV